MQKTRLNILNEQFKSVFTRENEFSIPVHKRILTDLVMLDFSKTFDRIPHQRRLREIDHYVIRGSTHHWIASFLVGRTQQVLVEGEASEKIPVVSGVPQGSVLGPLLFLLTIKALPNNLNSFSSSLRRQLWWCIDKSTLMLTSTTSRRPSNSHQLGIHMGHGLPSPEVQGLTSHTVKISQCPQLHSERHNAGWRVLYQVSGCLDTV